MKAFTFLFSTLILILILSTKLTSTFNDRLIVFWLLFNIFIGYIEAKMFLNQNTMSKKKEEYDKNPYFYEKNYSLSELKTDFAVDGFLEYVRHSGDTRYIETNKGDFVTWLEMLNAIISLIFSSIIIFGIVTKKINILIIAILVLILSSMQLYGTVLYFLSYYTKVNSDKVDKGIKWVIHLFLFNLPWIVVPLILIQYYSKIIVNLINIKILMRIY